MARKHNARHNRSRSRYPERLADRGVSGAQVRMPFIGRHGHVYETAKELMSHPREAVAS